MNWSTTRFRSAVLLAVALTLPLIAGCATSHTEDPRVVAAEMDEGFNAWLQRLMGQVQADPTYKRIPLDTKSQRDEFIVWLHSAYHKKVTKQELANWINGKYPNHQHETAFILSKLP